MTGEALWPLGLYCLIVVGVVGGGMIGLSALLGERHSNRTTGKRATGEPYEGGVISAGSARVRLSAHFYLIAMFFVIFDLEAVYLFAWAVAARELGWLGYAEILVFVGLLLAAWIYLWRIGALDWGPSALRRRAKGGTTP